MSISKGIGGDNTLTISSRTVENSPRPIIEVIEYGTDDYRVVHYKGEKLYDAIDIANAVITDEQRVAQVEHELFSATEVREALFPNAEHWRNEAKAYADYIRELGNHVGNYLQEGLIEGTEDLLMLMSKLHANDLIDMKTVTVRVTGTMTREYTIDCEIEVAPWHANSTAHIERYYESDIVEITDDDYDCNTSIDIEDVERN